MVFGGKKEYAGTRTMSHHVTVSLLFFGKETGDSMSIFLGSPRGLGETMSRQLGFGSQTGVSQRHWILI
jgi:hypothetical protein